MLVDSNALIHRAYHAYPATLTTKDGQQINAVFGFTKLLLEVIKRFNPKYLVCVFDSPKPTFRHEKFKEYKAHRKPLDPELISQFPMAREVVASFNIPLFIQDGFEADDLIGALAKTHIPAAAEKVIITGDQDILQLVDDKRNIAVYMAGNAFVASKLYQEADVAAKYGFTPAQVIDYKALLGDPPDNIPGVPGIGKKGAVELIREFGTVDAVYQSLKKDDAKWQEQPWKRMAKKLVAGEESAFISKDLATINLEAPVEFTLRQAELADYDPAVVKALFERFEFRSLYRELPFSKNSNSAEVANEALGVQQLGIFAGPETVDPTPASSRQVNYQILTTETAALAAIKKIGQAKDFAFDTETDSLNVFTARILGVGIATSLTEAYFFSEVVLQKPTVRQGLYKLFGQFFAEKFVIAHHLKFDLHVMNNYFLQDSGVDPIVTTSNTFDTLIAIYLLNAGDATKPKGLKELALRHLSMKLDTLAELLGVKRNSQINAGNLNIETLGNYCCDDAAASYGLYELFNKQLAADTKLVKLFKQIEMPLVGVLVAMEREGVYLDKQQLELLASEIRAQLQVLESQIYQAAGESFNIASPRQVGEVLFNKLQIQRDFGFTVAKTKNGSYSTDERTLRNFSAKNELVAAILTYRELSKLLSTYVLALPEQVNLQTGKVHTSYNQTIASTGRLASLNPNLQNIPIASEQGRKVRKAFTAGPDKQFLAFDYAQQELRLLAHLSSEEKLLAAFNENIDIHSLTAAEILRVPLEQVTSAQRRIGKTVNFGVIYGISGFGLADRLKIDRREADEFIAKFFTQYPKVRDYFDNLKREAKQQGAIYTLLGRKRETRGLGTANYRLRSALERELINFPLQGGAADIMKLAMLEAFSYTNQAKVAGKYGLKLLLQVHDEIIFSLPLAIAAADLQQIVTDVCQLMSGVVNLQVPLLVDAELGPNWQDMEKI